MDDSRDPLLVLLDANASILKRLAHTEDRALRAASAGAVTRARILQDSIDTLLSAHGLTRMHLEQHKSRARNADTYRTPRQL